MLLFILSTMLLGIPLFWSSTAYCRSGGLKYFKNYSPNDYFAQAQNWSVLQDKHGIIFVGNNGGLLEYDGVSWRRNAIPNFTVRSLALDDTGTLYAGGINEIGFFSTDAKGELHYESLVDRLDEKERNFAEVWKTHAAKEGIYFRTSKFLFRWNAGKMTVWETDRAFNASFLCEGNYFVHQRQIGLMQMVDDSLQLIPGDQTFAAVKIYMMVPYDAGKFLIGTRENGFYIYDGIKAVPFPTQADDYLKEKHLYYGIRLTSGDFALATRLGGLVIMDPRGRIKDIFDKTYGLQDDNVRYVFEDSQENLWLGLDIGISKIEYAAPFSCYDDRSGLSGQVLSAARHHGDLYVGTTNALYSLTPTGPDTFHPVPKMSSGCWSLLSAGNSVLAATFNGVFQIENDIIRRIIANRSYVLSRSIKKPSRIWVGTDAGLISLSRENGNNRDQWTREFEFENINLEVNTIVEDNAGNLWLGTGTQGVLNVRFSDGGTIDNPVVTRYDTSNGLPAGEINVFMAAGHVMFASPTQGVFRFDEEKKAFVPDLTLGTEFADGTRGVFRIAEDKNNNIWFHSNARNYKAIPRDRTYVFINSPLRIPIFQVNAVLPEDNGDIVWLGGRDGLIRYDTRINKDARYDFITLIRKVSVQGNPVFDGYGRGTKPLFPVFNFEDRRNFYFECAAPFFKSESKNEYQYFLEGFENGWSDWSTEARKSYLEIAPGTYRFRVRAKNVYGDIAREDVFQFKILLPWYRSWWAFLIYTLAFFSISFLVVKWRRSRALEQEKQRLEQIVRQRAREILEKNRQLEEQAEKLKEMDHVKSRFFANISHEFRTPLTLIMGPLEQMLSDSNDQKQYKKLHLMLRNSQRLLGLINQLLELSKFESGKVKLQASPQNIVPFIKGVAASFEILAAQRDLELAFHAGDEEMIVSMDPGKMEEVLSNILINAVKFTPAGGKVTITAKTEPAKETGFPHGSVVISISDTRPGIPPEQLAHIFDRFYQSDATFEHHRKGSGIGLAIAKELVELHNGTIRAHSTEGEGTEFIIRLPGVPADDKGVPIDYMSALPVDVQAEMENGGDESVADAAVQNNEPGASEKDIILVVEDNADVRDYIRGSVEDDYSVVEAGDGEEGIQRALDIIPDIIISDIMMPKADGYELCRRLKKDVRTSHIPIILLTAKASEENIVAGLETGADDYVTKPFSTKILCARIKNLIDLRRQLQMNLNREMTLQPVKTAVSEIDREFLEDLKAALHKNIADPEFNVEELSKKLYMSRATLYRKIHALSGESPTEFLRSYRLKRAAELLKRNYGSVLEVAFAVGFSSAAYFTKCFKEKFHRLPSSFQATEADH